MESARVFLDGIKRILGMLIGVDNTGNIVYASDEAKETFGYGDEMIGTSIVELIPSVFTDITDYDELSEYLEEHDKEIMAYRKNDTCFPVKIKLEVLKLDKSVYFIQVINLLEQTNMKNKLEKAEIEAKEAFSKQSRFVANVTHELRTPVNGIKGHVAFLMEQGGLSEVQLDTMKIIERCCINMENIINSLLDFSKLDSGKFTIETREFDFREMMQQVLDTNIKQANLKGIALTMSIADTIPDKLYGDPLRVTQILNNLISNAVKFTSVGYVRVEVVDVARRGNNIEIFFMVIDTGIGIDEEGIDKLFKSFSQVDGSITRKYGGTGLGLAISKQLIEMMHGSIKVQSEKGKGSTFAFSIILKTCMCDGNGESKEAENTDFEDSNKIEQLQADFDSIINKVVIEDMSEKFVWGSRENKEEIEDTLNKMVLCVEMGAWEKAEGFADKLKKLSSGADMDVKKQIFRLQSAVRNGDYERSKEEYNELNGYLGKG